MFYVKEKSGTLELKVDITDENVYTTCPKCGREFVVDLASVLGDGESDLFGTAIYCHECSLKYGQKWG